MPDSIVKETIREIEPLSVDDTVAEAAKRVVELEASRASRRRLGRKVRRDLR